MRWVEGEGGAQCKTLQSLMKPTAEDAANAGKSCHGVYCRHFWQVSNVATATQAPKPGGKQLSWWSSWTWSSFLKGLEWAAKGLLTVEVAVLSAAALGR